MPVFFYYGKLMIMPYFCVRATDRISWIDHADDDDIDVLLYLSDAAAQYLICKFQLDRVVHFWQNSLSKVDFRE